jgi:hypothetical protein
MHGGSQSIVAFGANDAWLTANLGQSPEATYDPNRGLLHWDGAWHVIGDVHGALVLWGSGPDDVWVASGAIDPSNPVACETRRWNGSAWIPVPLQDCVTSISGKGPNDVWLRTGSYATGDLGHLYHYDGATYALIPLSSSPCGFSILSGGSGEVWDYGGCVARWDGGVWQTFAAPSTIATAWSSNANDVWFIGAATDRASLVRWDGRALAQDVAQPVGPALRAASGSGPNDLWVGGAGGAILRTSLPSHATTR